jgi:beta-glucosidase
MTHTPHPNGRDRFPAWLSRRDLLRRGALAGASILGGPVLSACQGDDGNHHPTPSASPNATRAPLTFPDTFRWGAATSAYQVEGATAEDGRGPSIWDTFSHLPGRTRGGDTGDVAADHYHRYADDVDLMKSLGLQSYRFSIAWPRVIPTGRGAVNPKGIDFYRRLVDALLAKGIAPMATLFHWDLPQPLQDKGGWENRDCAKWFADYATVVYRALGDVVPTFLTINEPKTIALYAYGDAPIHAPGVRGAGKSAVVAHHLLLAHGLGVQAYRANGARGRIGVALSLAPVYPADPAAESAVAWQDGLENRLYLDPILRGRYPQDMLSWLPPGREVVRADDLTVIGSPIDILAVQYYNAVYVNASGGLVTKRPTSVAPWQQIYPEGFYEILVRLKNEYAASVPITITENGIPTRDVMGADGKVDDPQRITFLADHLHALQRAIENGVRVESYHVWSLLDNFEWAEGYTQRWGIVYIDYATKQRVPKASARWYRDVIMRNRLQP